MDNTPSAVKTYSVALLAWVWALVPKTFGEWTELFEMIGAAMAAILVIWRFMRESRRPSPKPANPPQHSEDGSSPSPLNSEGGSTPPQKSEDQ